MEWTERSSRWWDELAAHWDQENDAMFQTGPRAEVLQFFREFAGAPPLRMLDFGCGPGAAASLLTSDGYDVIGADQAPKMVEAAQRRGVHSLVSDGNPLPFPDASFDAVFVCTSLEWSDQPHLLIKEIARVVKPGGRVVAVTLGPWAQPRWSAYGRLYGNPVNHNMMMPWELQKLLEEHDLASRQMHGVYPKAVPQEAVSAVSGNWVWQSSLAILWAIGAVKL